MKGCGKFGMTRHDQPIRYCLSIGLSLVFNKRWAFAERTSRRRRLKSSLLAFG